MAEPPASPEGPAGPEGEPEQRLMIAKIVCENFKSYAGTKELGPFHKCFSSIVGPNGSGKSNVIDAMLFVFGYRARKIRSKKISVLIHNSEHHQDLRSCTVSVHFQMIVDLPGDDDYRPVPGSQFVISRTAFKDNSSYYQLNGKKAPFKEVATLLRQSGIDLDHNRFLILQGEVEQIALMKPRAQSEHDEGMLEFLEDIIGTSRFKELIEQLATRVEELNEARGEKLNRVKAVEKEKNELEGAKNEAEEFLAMQRDVARKQLTLYQRYIHECSQHESKAREKMEELEAEVEELQSGLNQFAADKKEKLKAQKKDYRAYERLVQQNDDCKEQLNSCEQRDVRARQDLKHAKGSLKKAGNSLNKEREKLAELEASPERLQREIRDLEKKLKILEARKSDEEQKLVEVMESLKTATQDLQAEKEEQEVKLIDLNQAVNEAKSKLDVAQAELDIYRERFTSGERQLEGARASLEEASATLTAKNKTLSALQRSIPGKKEDLARAQSQLKAVGEGWERLSLQVRQCRSQLEEGRSGLQAQRSRGQVLEALMEQKSSGAIPGIHGRLGDLGAIDEQYDVAISTACGALDHIVVDSMDTAIRCVEFLKRGNVGMATFIALDKVEHWRKKATSKIQTPEGVPRLFDVVRVQEPTFHTAFYFALRDTLVATDLDQATRIGLQGRTRHRVVTLGGQLIDTSGTMSGGGTKVLRGRMSSRLHVDVTPQQLSELEKSLGRDEQALQECAQRRAELEGTVKTLRGEIAEGERELKKLGREVQVLHEQTKALEERIRHLEEENAGNKMDPAHLAQLEKHVQQFKKEHQKAADAAGEVQSEVQRLHDRIMEVSGGRMQKQQAQVDAVRKEIDASTAAITKAHVGIKTAERNTKKSRDKITSLEKEVEETEVSVEELKASLTALEEEAKEVIWKQEEIHATMAQHEELLAQLKAEVEAIDAREREVQEKAMDLRHELEKYSTKLRENMQKIKHFQNEIRKLDLGEEGVPELSAEELGSLDKQAVEYEITMLEEKLNQMTPNMAAIEEYRKKDEAHQTRLGELDAITTERDEVRARFEDMRKQRLDEFMAGFSVITSKLKEMYQMITLGGDAELELVDSLDPFSEGIVFSVRPPKKSWKNISNLSGGEKTLSSLALVFALHHYKPSPLYVMDEIDAALDFKNVSIVANYIKERTKNAQFIIISLRNNMFELADRLVGIYKTDNCTKSVTVDPRRLSMGARPIQPLPA